MERGQEIKHIRATLKMGRPVFGEVCILRCEQSIIKYENGTVTPTDEVMERARKWMNLYNEIHGIKSNGIDK